MFELFNMTNHNFIKYNISKTHFQIITRDFIENLRIFGNDRKIVYPTCQK